MFDTKKSKQALRAAALGLAVAGTFALPSAGAQEAASAISQDNAVVVKDGVTGKLRAATVQENNALKENNGNAKKQMMRVAPQQTLKKYHRSGATGARLTDEFMSSATVARAADGSLVHECVDVAGHVNHAPQAASPAPTTVTE